MGVFKQLYPYYRYLRLVRGPFALGIGFGMLYSISSGLGLPVLAETIFPILFGSFDQAPDWLTTLVERWFGDDPGLGFLLLCCMLIPVTMLLRAAGAFGNGYFMTYSGLSVIQSIQKEVFNKIQYLPLAFFQRYKTGELIAAISGYPNQIKKIVVDTSNDLVKQPLTLISALSFLVYKSITSESFFIAVIGVLSVPAVVFPIRKIGKYLARRSRQLVHLGEALNSSTIEAVQSPLEIRAYGLEERQVQGFAEKLRGIFKLTLKSVRTSLLLSPSIEVVSATGLAVALFLGVRSGMSQGEFLGLAVAMYMAYEPIKKLGKIHGALRALEAPLQRLEAILQAPENLPEPLQPHLLPNKVRGELQFEAVDFKYANADVSVLRAVNVHIKAGERVGLVGASGAGKSTFVNLIPRFFDPSSGVIRLDGLDLRDLSVEDLRRQIAYVPQMPLLFNTSVRENIRMGRFDASDAEVAEAARQASALEFIEEMPEGFDTVISERGGSLSGGQRQRIAIARAFLRDAPILILDEATSALDNRSDADIQATIERLSQDRTTLVIAHRLNTLERFERRLYFEDGCLVGDGGHAELLESCEGYSRLCAMGHSEAV